MTNPPSAAAAPLVFVVDDDELMRETVSRMVRDLGIEVETFESAAAFLSYARPDRPSCLVLDVMLQGATGFDVVAALTEGKIELPTIFMTGSGTIPMSVQAMRSGAVEFLTKPFDSDALKAALDRAVPLAVAQRARKAERQFLEALLASLTPREYEVLTHVVAGKMNKQIAADLGVVEQTVKVHRARSMEKLGARSVADLVRLMERVAALRA